MRGLDDRPPFRDLGLLPISERLRRRFVRWWHLQSEVLQVLARLRVAQRIERGRIELGDDLFRRALWRPQSRPQRHVEVRQTGFVDARYVGGLFHALGIGDGVSADAASTDLVDG